MDLLTAVERADASIPGLSERPADAPAGMPSAADNDRALAELQGMMRGVK